MALLKGIRAEMTGFQNKLYLPHALHKTMIDFYSLSQGKHRNNQEYLDEFNLMVITAEESGATIGTHPGGVIEAINSSAVDPSNPTDAERGAAIKSTTERYLAVASLLGADRFRYGTLVEEIENEYLRNKGDASSAGTYPTTVAKAYDYLYNYKKGPKNLSRLLGQHSGNDLNTGVAFAQDGDQHHQDTPNQASKKSGSHEHAFATTGGAGSYASRKTICRRCGAEGHNSIDCDSTKEKVDIYRQSQQANQGVSQLIHAVDWDGTNNSPDNEAQNWVFLQKATLFKSDGPI
jgi:hypothetical protein